MLKNGMKVYIVGLPEDGQKVHEEVLKIASELPIDETAEVQYIAKFGEIIEAHFTIGESVWQFLKIPGRPDSLREKGTVNSQEAAELYASVLNCNFPRLLKSFNLEYSHWDARTYLPNSSVGPWPLWIFNKKPLRKK